MKFWSCLTILSALQVAPASAVEYTIETCADLSDVDDTMVTTITIGSGTFACDEYTRFRVRNTMTLKATTPSVEFSNFSLKVLGDLTVEPDVVFKGVTDQVKNGGVLHVSEEANVTFMGTSSFAGNSVRNKPVGNSYVTKKGGAVHNKGMLTFEEMATFARNEVHTDGSTDRGKGGAISNVGSGSILFKGGIVMEENLADGFFAGLGGAIYSRGNIVVDGESEFFLNAASDGGGIYQTSIGTLTFNGMANFTENTAYELRGGGLYNGGGVVDFNGGSLFEGNRASGSGDGGFGGGIYNGDEGVITLTDLTTFISNAAYWGGAIYTDDGDLEDGEAASITTFPADTIFVDNSAEYCPDVNNGDNGDCPDV